ncbi:hypothetical protein GUY40_01200 [Pseudomonas sp. R5(2019)]|nr:hypothetical protein [Pseudomonas sp. R5(2019)]
MKREKPQNQGSSADQGAQQTYCHPAPERINLGRGGGSLRATYATLSVGSCSENDALVGDVYGLHREVEQDHAADQRDQGRLGSSDGQPGKRQEPQRNAGNSLPQTLIGPATGSSGSKGTGDAGQAKQADCSV